LDGVKHDRGGGTNRLIHDLQKPLTFHSRHNLFSSPLKDDEPAISWRNADIRFGLVAEFLSDLPEAPRISIT
jgi:hypothetical protein